MNTILHTRCTLVRVASQTFRRAGNKRSIPETWSYLQSPTYATTVSKQQRHFASSTSDNNDKPPHPTPAVATATVAVDNQSVFERTVYVHPLSQIILEHLQGSHHDFVIAHGLEVLTLNRDGSFELRFPHQPEDRIHRIWTAYDEVEKKHWLIVYRGPNVNERFILQDNLLPAWNTNRKSLPERIHAAVDEMVRMVRSQV